MSLIDGLGRFIAQFGSQDEIDIYRENQSSRFKDNPLGFVFDIVEKVTTNPFALALEHGGAVLRLEANQLHKFFESRALVQEPVHTTCRVPFAEVLGNRRVCQVVQIGSAGAAGVGGVGTVIGVLGGIPELLPFTIPLAINGAIATGLADQLSRQLDSAEVLEALRTTNRNLTTQVQHLTTQVHNLTEQNRIYVEQNRIHGERIRDLTAQVDRLSTQNVQYELHNRTHQTLMEQFGRSVEQFRAGNGQDRAAFQGQLDAFIQQMTNSQALWTQIEEDRARFGQDSNALLTQLRSLIAQMTDPNSTLPRLQEHRELNQQIQAAVERLNHIQTERSRMEAQIAEREGQLRAHSELLSQLRSAHEQILASYREHTATFGTNNTLFEAQVQRVNTLFHRFLGVFDVVINHDVGFPNSLGICSEPSWEPRLFSHTLSGWQGAVPHGRSFKFVQIRPQGGLRWEQGPNRRWGDAEHMRNDLQVRRILF